MSNIVWFNDITMEALPQVGGKIASLGEMINHLSQAGVKVPQGFATTADAFRHFLAQDGLQQEINRTLAKLDINDISALKATGESIRKKILATPFTQDFKQDIHEAFKQLQKLTNHLNEHDLRVAIRSSATAE